MHVRRHMAGCILIAILAPLTSAQEREVIMQPAARSARLPKLSDLVKAKIVGEEPQGQLVVMAEAYRVQERPVQVTRRVQQTRTRVVRLPDGTTEEQEYTVLVPVTRTEQREIKVSAGVKPVTIPAADCRFFDLEGRSLDYAAAARSLRTLKTIFLQEACEGELPEIPSAFRDVLKSDCILVLTHRTVRSVVP